MEEPESFSSQITDKPGWHYFATVHSKYSDLIKELKEIKMFELMEKKISIHWHWRSSHGKALTVSQKMRQVLTEL